MAHAFLRAVSPFVATSHPLVAHALSAPRGAPVAHGSAVVLPRLAAVVFEPRSRGFSEPLLGQSFYGWHSAPCPPLVLFGARPPLAAERGLGVTARRQGRRALRQNYTPVTSL